MIRAFVLAAIGTLSILSFSASAADAPAAPQAGPDLVAANPGGATTLIALLDYEDLSTQMLRQKLGDFIKSNRDIRVVVKPWASNGALARLSAKVAYAAERQGKFAAFHDAMLADSGAHTYFSFRDMTPVLGLDWERMQKDLDDPKVGEAVDANGKYAESQGVKSGPAFVAGARVFNTPWNQVDFAQIATEARAAKG